MNAMKQNRIDVLFMVMVALVLGWSCNNGSKTDTATGTHAPVDSAAPAGSVSLLIHLPAGDKAVPGIAHQAGMTILDAMKLAREDGKLAFRDSVYPGLGPFVAEIESVSPANGFFWMFCVNDTSGTVGVSAKVLNLGDQVEWHYVNTENPPCKPSN